MEAVRIVVAVDVIEEFGLRVLQVEERAALEHFAFEGGDERFGPGIIVGVSPGRHALAKTGPLEGGAEGGAGILAATIAVEDDGLAGRTGFGGLGEGLEDEFRA